MATTVMRISETQRNRIKEQEGLRLNAYLCTAGRWTIGWGHAETNARLVRGLLNGKYYEGKPKLGVSITLDEARRLFDADVDEVERQVSALITQDLAQHQFDPLVDFVYQFGIGNLSGSTLIGKINKNPNNLGEDGYPGILDEFPRWNRENGHRVEHVWRRSCRRACIYANAPIPQPLWRKNGFPFALTVDDQIDYSITPTIHKIIAYGRKVAEKPTFDPNKPLPELESERIKVDDVTADVLNTSGIEPSTIAVESLPLPDLILEEQEAEELPPAAAQSQDTNIGERMPVSPGSTLDPIAPQPPEAAPASSLDAAPPATATAEAKNPINSWTIWGGAALYFLPDFAPIAEKLLTVEVAGPIGVVLRTTALVLLVLGRVSASLPVSIKAKAKLPLRKT